MYETGCYREGGVMRKIINLLQNDWLSKQFNKKDCKTGRISSDAVHVLGQESQDSFTDREYTTVSNKI